MIADAARGERCFVDTNILVYAHDTSEGLKREVARGVITALWASRSGCVSVQVLQELFVTLTRKVSLPLSARAATTVVEDLTAWTLHAPNGRDILAAIAVHERAWVTFWDAMILTSARSLGCRVLYSEDLGAGQRDDGVLVVNPFAETR